MIKHYFEEREIKLFNLTCFLVKLVHFDKHLNIVIEFPWILLKFMFFVLFCSFENKIRIHFFLVKRY